MIEIPGYIAKTDRHNDIVKKLWMLNPEFRTPGLSGDEANPDLVSKGGEVIEVATSDLLRALGQCTMYDMQGTTKVHLVLTEKLFMKLEKWKDKIPIPMDVYCLPKPGGRKLGTRLKTVRLENSIYDRFGALIQEAVVEKRYFVSVSDFVMYLITLYKQYPPSKAMQFR